LPHSLYYVIKELIVHMSSKNENTLRQALKNLAHTEYKSEIEKLLKKSKVKL